MNRSMLWGIGYGNDKRLYHIIYMVKYTVKYIYKYIYYIIYPMFYTVIKSKIHGSSKYTILVKYTALGQNYTVRTEKYGHRRGYRD